MFFTEDLRKVKRKWFQFVIILLISLSIILAFSESVKPQTINPWELEKWKLSIDLDVDKCSSDQQIKIGHESLFCLTDVAKLPHPDSPDYWQRHTEKVREKAKEFSNNLTNFANTSISVEDLEMKDNLVSVEQNCYKKSCKNFRYYWVKKVGYEKSHQYFNNSYFQEIMDIGIAQEKRDQEKLKYEQIEEMIDEKFLKKWKYFLDKKINKKIEQELEIKLEIKCKYHKNPSECQTEIERSVEQKFEKEKSINSLEDYIRFAVEEYRKKYGLNQPPNDSEQSQDEQSRENEQELRGLRSQAVKVGEKTIFYIRTWHNRMSPQERAKKANEKIRKILNNEIDIQGLGVFSEPSKTNQSTNENDTSSQQKSASKLIRIISDNALLTENDKMILSINQNDAALEGEKSTEILAKKRLEKIMKAIDQQREKLLKGEWNFSSGIVGGFVKLNGENIFYIKPDAEEESFDSSFRATSISKKINDIADRWWLSWWFTDRPWFSNDHFDKNALMAGYLIVDQRKKKQRVCILVESLPDSQTSSLKNNSQSHVIEVSTDNKGPCNIVKIEKKNHPLAIIYSKKILNDINDLSNKKKNVNLKLLEIKSKNSKNNQSNQLIDYPWILDKREQKTSNQKRKENITDNQQFFETIMIVKRNDPDLEKFPSQLTREALAIHLIERFRDKIDTYRSDSIMYVKIYVFGFIVSLILSIFFLWTNFLNNFINNLTKNYLSNKYLKLLVVSIAGLPLYILLISLFYNNGILNLFKTLFRTPWVLINLLPISLGLILFVSDTDDKKFSKCFLKIVCYLLNFLIPVFFLIKTFSSFYGSDEWTKSILTKFRVFIEEHFDNIRFYIWDEVPDIIVLVLLAIFAYIVAYIFVNIFVNIYFNNISKKVDVVLQKLTNFSFIKKNKSSFTNAIFNILVVLITVLSLILIAPHLPGAGTIYFNAFSAFILLILGWSGSSIISDFIAGLILIFGDSVHEGDWIKIKEIFGKIKKQDLLVHRIKTPKNCEITIPNSKILRELTTNFTLNNDNNPKTQHNKSDKLILYTSVSLGYNTPRGEVEEALIKAAKNTAKKKNMNNIFLNDDEYPPFVLLDHLGDFSITYELNVYIDHLGKEQDILEIYSELHKNIQDECNKAGIEIMSPNYFAIRDGNDPTIPKSLIKTSKS